MAKHAATKSTNRSKVSTKWLNNVMKSIGAASIDNFKEIAPNLSELGSGAANAVSSIRSATKGSSVAQVKKEISNNSAIKSVKKSFTNTLEDLKSGKIYNPERNDQAMNDYLGMDLDSEFSFDDWDDNEGAAVNFNYIDERDSSSSNSNAVLAEAINSSAQANVKAQKASVDAMISIASAGMLQSQELAKETNMHLSNISNGISAIVQFQQENTLKFYESAMAVFDRYAQASEKEGTEPERGPDIFNSSKGISISKYKEYVKKQIKSTYKNSSAGSTLDMLLGNDMLDMFLANPIGAATKGVLAGVVPNIVTNTIKNVEDAFTGFMPTMLAKLGDWRKSEEAGMKGALQRLIGNVFGIKVNTKNGFDIAGKVDKDAAIFDGVTRNSIVEVIPKHLREMSSYLKDIAEHFNVDTSKSKENAEIFDTETTTYRKVGSVKNDIAKELSKSISDAFMNTKFGEALQAGGSQLVGEDKKTYGRMMDQMFQIITRMNDSFNPESMNFNDKNSPINQIMGYIDTNSKREEKILSVLQDTIKLMNKNQVGVHHAAKAQMDAKLAFNNTRNALSDNYDTRNLVAAGLNEDTDIFEFMDKTLGNKKAQKIREEHRKREEEMDKAREKRARKGSLRGSSRKIAQQGLQSGNYIPDSETSRGRQEISVRTANASTIPGLIANAGTHAKNSMFALMNGDSKGAIKEFSSIFSDSMKTFFGTIKDNFLNPLKESIFGKKDENGFVKGGMFGGIQNKVKDVWHEMGSKIKGNDWTDSDGNVHKGEKENSVLGKVSSIMHDIGDSVKYRLFGEKDEEGKKTKEGVIGGIIGTLKEGLNGWKTALFGEKDPEKSKDEIMKSFKQKAMDAIPSLGVGAIGGLVTSQLSGGLLGAMIGGPIGGIVLGMGTSLLAKSSKFQDYLFGPEVEDEDGNKKRIGGLVSAKTQEMFKDPKLKKFMVGGAAIGLGKNMLLGSSGGLLGTLVGGPIAGALIGAAGGFILKSQMFKDFFFGNEEEGKEGFKDKFKKKVKDTFKSDSEDDKEFKKRVGMGAISGIGGGLLGFMAGGPIIGALGGLAIGIKASSKKFNTWLFGEKNEKGEKTKEGVIGKVGNYIHVNVMAPMKTKALELIMDAKTTLKHQVFGKLLDVVNPLVDVGNMLVEKVKKMATKGGNFIKKLMSPFVKISKTLVFNPVKKILGGVADLAYKSVKATVTIPVRVITGLTNIITSPFIKAAKKIGDAVDEAKNFFKETIKNAGKSLFKKTIGKGLNFLKAAGNHVKNKASNAVFNGIEKVSKGRVRGKEGLNNLLRKAGFNRDFSDRDNDARSERIENRHKIKNRKIMDKNRAKLSEKLGYDVKYFTEEDYNKLIEEKPWLKNTFNKNLEGKLEFEKDPKREAEKMREAARKLSDDDILTADGSKLDIEGRQLQQQTRTASLLDRLVSFFTGKKSTYGVGVDNQDENSDNESATSTATENNSKDGNNSTDSETEGSEDDGDASVQSFTEQIEAAGGLRNYIKMKASDIWGKVKSKFSKLGRARAKGGDVDKDKSYLVGDGGDDPNAAEIFTPKTKGKVLSQQGNGIKVFIAGIASNVVDKVKGMASNAAGAIKNKFSGGIHPGSFFGGSNNTEEDSDEADDIAIAKIKANSEADYDEEGNIIKEKADTSDIDDIKDADAKKDAIVDADNAADLANARNAGSYEAQQKKKQAQAEDEKAQKQRDAINGVKEEVKKGNETSKSHFLSWDTIFSKKGLITLGVIGLAAAFPGLVTTVVDTVKDIIDVVKPIAEAVWGVLSGIAGFVGKTVQALVKEGKKRSEIGVTKDGKTGSQNFKDTVDSMAHGNVLAFNEDGSASSLTGSLAKSYTKHGLNMIYSDTTSFTKGTKKSKKRANRIKKIGSTPNNIYERTIKGKKDDASKFARKNRSQYGFKLNKDTGKYTDRYGRTAITKEEWENMKSVNSKSWIENNQDNYFVIGDKKLGKKAPRTGHRQQGNIIVDKTQGFLDKTVNKAYDTATDFVDTTKTKIKNKVGEKFENSVAGKAKNKAKELAGNAGKKIKNSKGYKGAKKIHEGVTDIKNGVTGAIDNAKQKGKDAVKNAGKKVANKGKELAAKAGQTIKDKTLEVGKKGMTAVSDAAGKTDSKLMSKVCGFIESFLSKICDKIAGKTGKGAGKILKCLSKIKNSIFKNLKKIFTKITGKLTAFLSGRISIGAATLCVGEIIFTVGGAIDAATSAAKIFGVPRDKVDGTMRIISVAYGALTSTTTGGVADIVFEAIKMESETIDIPRAICVTLYRFLKGDEATEAMEKSHDQFLKEYDEYKNKELEKQWQTQKKAGIIGENVSYDEFVAGLKTGQYQANVKSYDDYNTDKNGGISDKVMSGAGKAVNWIGNRISEGWSGKEKYQDDKGNTYTKNDDGTFQVTDKDGKDIGAVSKDAIDTSKMKDVSSGGLKGTLKKGWTAVKNGVGGVVNKGKELLGKGIDAVKNSTVGKAVGAAGNALKTAGKTALWAVTHPMDALKKGKEAVTNFLTSDTEEVYQNPKDGTYYKLIDGKFYLFNKLNQQISKKEYPAADIITATSNGELIKTEITTREAGIVKGVKAVGNALKNGAKKTVEGLKAGANAVKNFAVNRWKDLKAGAGKLVDLGKKALTGVKNFFINSKETVYRKADGTYYNEKGECFNSNGERIKGGDINQEELLQMIKTGQVVKDEIKKDSGIVSLAKKGWNLLKTGAKKAWEGLKKLGSNIVSGAKKAGKAIVSGIKKAGTAIKNFFVGSKETIYTNSDGTYYNEKGECFNKNGERLKAGDITQEELAQKIKTGVVVKSEKKKDSGIVSLAKKGWSALTSGLKKGWEGLKKFGSSVKEKLGEAKDKFFEIAKDPIGSIKSFFKNSKKTGFLAPDGSYFIDSSNGKLTSFEHYTATGDLIEKITDKEQVEDIKRKIKSGVYKATTITDKSGFKKLGETIQNKISDAWQGIKNGASNLWSGIKNFFTGGGDDDNKVGDIPEKDIRKAGKSENNANQSKIRKKDVPAGGNGDDDNQEQGGNGETVNGFSYFSQKDKRWKNNQYLSKDGKYSSSMSKSGCGPTAFAMVANQLKGNKVDPTTIAEDATNSGYRDETGTNAKFISYEADKYGLDSSEMDNPTAEYIVSQMDKGRPMILNGVKSHPFKRSAYTKSGHYVVAVGRDKNGNILINDPRGKNKSVAISPTDLAKETRIGWTFNSPNKSTIRSMKKIGGHGENTFTAEDVINIAKGEVGYSEKASNSDLDDKKKNAGSGNYTKYAKEVGHSNGLAWCATFVVWCFTKAANGDKKKAKEVLCGANSAASANNSNAFKSAGRLDMNPQPGDVVFFMNGSSHTGIVIAVNGNKITTIEGNTSPGKFNRDGGCVAQHEYDYKKYSRISGFGHPKYDGSSTFNGETGTADSSDDSTEATKTDSNASVSSFTEKFTNLFSQYSEKALNGMMYGKWDYNFDLNNDSSSSSSSTDSSSTSGETSDSEATSDGKVDTTMEGKNNIEKVWNFFKNNGFSDAATAGILGNMYQESGVNPKSIQGNGKGPAAGIFQWENYNSKSDRFGNLYKRAKKKGVSWKDLTVQLEYGLDEMRSKDMNGRFSGTTGNLKPSGYTQQDIDGKSYTIKALSDGFEGFKKMTDATEATKTFEGAFERAGKPNFKRRISFAKQMMSKYAGKQVGGKGEDDGIASYTNDMNERYFNPQYKGMSSFTIDRNNMNIDSSNNGTNITNIMNTKKLEQILEKAVSVLESIDKSTSLSQQELKTLNTTSTNQMNNITNNNIYNTQRETNPSGTTQQNRNYKLAELLAKG